jgi:hypothetical protein
MRCFVALLIIMASITAADAAGSSLTTPVPTSRAGVPTPSLSPGDLLGGCGRGRYRDP